MKVRALAIAAAAPVLVAVLHADDWPHWRGPRGIGVSTETGLPERWSASENIGWKAPLAGLGVSTPIASGDFVIVTSQVGAGTKKAGRHPTLTQGGDPSAAGERALGVGAPADPAGGARFVVEAFRRADGRRAWVYQIDAEGPRPEVHEKHNMASPSPTSDGERIYAWFATGQIVALDVNGKLVWQRKLGEEGGAFDVNWGHSSSPTLYEDLLLLLCDHESSSYLLAVDKRTGKDRWRVDRGKGRASYSTPVVVQGPTGPEMIVNSSERLDAYDPRNGAHLWFTGGSNRFPIPTPTLMDGVLYTSRGYRSGPYLAIRPGGRGDIIGTHVIWESPTGAPYVSSLVAYDGLVYMSNDNGVVNVVDAKSGERIWQERVGGVFSASPVAADGKIYMLSESGEMVVLKAGRPPAILARNDIGERTLASPAISNGQIFIRTDRSLVAIGKPRGASRPTADR
jgi:outer membrane protein assembly factor BamB